MKLSRGEWTVLAFNALYISGFSTYFAFIGNREFIGYIVTMLGLIALVATVHRSVRFPVSILWGLSLWGVAHMAGGGVPVKGSVLWHLLRTLYPMLRGTRTIYVFAALASMGLGAANEIVEFTAVLLIPNTNVGGYYNTALDLVFNAAGAIAAMIVCALVERSRLPNA